MSWHYLREVAGESLEDICLGGEPLPPLKSKTTHAEFYCKGKLTDSYLDSLSGTISVPLRENPGEVESMSSAGASLVRTSQPQEKGMDLMESGQDSGHKWRGWLAKFDPLSCSWRTAQCSLLGEEYESLLTLPRWGMTVDGLLWELPMLEHLTRGIGCGLSPDGQTFFHTPNTTGMDGGSNSRKALKKRQENWPTPVKSDCEMRRPTEKWKGTDLVSVVWTETGGRENPTMSPALLNANWVEWLMGWPIGWTDLKPLGTDKSPPVLPPLGDS
jgi:DNA (cytosine-5)-methyltransferase 1